LVVVLWASVVLTALTTGFDRIQLLWEDQASNDSGFQIERRSDALFDRPMIDDPNNPDGPQIPDPAFPTWSINDTTFYTKSANVSQQEVTGLAAGATYYFRVKAKGSSTGVFSGPTSPVSATIAQPDLDVDSNRPEPKRE
jgi:hypothetical protein